MRAGTQGDAINPWGVKLFRTLADGAAARRDTAVRLRQVARPDVGARGSAPRSHPRRRRRDPDHALDRALLHRGRDLRVHALLRRPRRARGRPGRADRLGRLGDGRADAVAERARRSVPRRCRRAAAGRDGALAADDRRRRSARSARRCSSRATRSGSRWPRDDRASASRHRSSSLRPCCSPSRPSRRRGAATSRPGGTASRRRQAARANALRIESAKAAGLANSQTEVDVATLHAVGQRLRSEADASWPTSTSSASATEFKPAVDAWIATRPLKNPNAPPTPFAMPQYKLAGARAGGPARGAGGGLRRPSAPQHPARIQLRARCRPVRVRAVLRGHEHQAQGAEAPRRDALRRLHRLPPYRDLDRKLTRQPERLSATASPGSSARRRTIRRNTAA